MNWLVVASLIACGCNTLFGIKDTDERPARYFDAPTDAPFACPSPGPPMFSRLLHQASTQDCTNYTVGSATGHALAVCYVDTGGPTQLVISFGDLDGALSPITLDPYAPAGGTGTLVPESARLLPDGEHLWVLDNINQATTNYNAVAEYARGPDGVWSFSKLVGLPVTSVAAFGIPSARAPRRVFVTAIGDTAISELEDTGTSWNLVGQYAPADLGLTSSPGMMQLTEDGLHLVVFGTISKLTFASATLYAARDELAARFPTPQALDIPAQVSDAFLTADCGYIYYSGLSSVFYAQQD